MNAITPQESLGDIVAGHPELAAVFERLGLDYCCGGRQTLTEACRGRSLEPGQVLSLLNAYEGGADGARESNDLAVADFTLAELVDHILETHHTYLKEEMPRLRKLSAKVAAVHGPGDPRLVEVRDVFQALSDELDVHMQKEEAILFPMIRALEEDGPAPAMHCGGLLGPVSQMEYEHEQAGSDLTRLRELTDEYRPPEHACASYRALLDGLERFERDMHRHVHKENNLLFPRAMERAKAAQAAE